jgi:hypothetical protein
MFPRLHEHRQITKPTHFINKENERIHAKKRVIKIPSTSGNNVYLMPGSSATSWTLLYAPHESWRSAQELATAIKSSIMAMGKMYFFIWLLFG